MARGFERIKHEGNRAQEGKMRKSDRKTQAAMLHLLPSSDSSSTAGAYWVFAAAPVKVSQSKFNFMAICLIFQRKFDRV